MPQRTMKRTGWRPDLPDQRDYRLTTKLSEGTISSSVDLRAAMPPVYDQGNLGSCVGNAVAAALQFQAMKEHGAADIPSRLLDYYLARAYEGTESYDAGATIRDGLKVAIRQGLCPETEWPYDITQFAVEPPPMVFLDSTQERVLQYLRVDQSVSAMKSCLSSGFPFLIGISVYASFLTSGVAQTGIVPMPGLSENLDGGHAILICGYHDSADGRIPAQAFVFRNSWGTGWGDQGYGYIPYPYLQSSDLAGDLWTVRQVD